MCIGVYSMTILLHNDTSNKKTPKEDGSRENRVRGLREAVSVPQPRDKAAGAGLRR